MAGLGDLLASHLQRSADLLLAAPYIKAATLARLLGDAGFESLRCVTRWRPEEVLAGVSDLESMDVISRFGGQLLLRHDLHAKYYRADEIVFVGSANLTATALGWAPSPNLEILVSPEAPSTFRSEFEPALLDGAVEATAAHRSAVEAAVEILRASGWSPIAPDDQRQAVEAGGEVGREVTGYWLPWCRTPDRLYRAYLRNAWGMTESNYLDALRDIASLGIPVGLSEGAFYEFVRALLSQQPSFVAFDQFIRDGRRSHAEMEGWIEPMVMRNRDPFDDMAEAWATMKAWLEHFFPRRYRMRLSVTGELIEVDQTIAEWRP